MISRFLVLMSKLLIKLLRLAGKNGSALPGLIIERLYPKFLEKNLKSVEKKIIIVTGTNGKTTTTKMLVTALKGIGKTVVTNNTGSNMTRGLIASTVEAMTYSGSLKTADWFVFEMDEAYTPIFTSKIHPKAVIGLNVLRDQLDRYGEIDKTASMIQKAANNADIFIYNALDPLLTKTAKNLNRKKLISFTVGPNLVGHVENEQSLHGKKIQNPGLSEADVALSDLKDIDGSQELKIKVNNNPARALEFLIPMEGFHNALNATAMVAAMSCMVDYALMSSSVHYLTQMEAPFGRGEKLHLNGKNITVALVKNPSGFMSNLETFVRSYPTDAILFVVNDRFADGRDVSWLWDVRFKEMFSQNKDTPVFTAGARGYDMALRLKYDDIDAEVTKNIKQSISKLMRSEYKNATIIPTYTSLFEVRNALSKYGKVPKIW